MPLVGGKASPPSPPPLPTSMDPRLYFYNLKDQINLNVLTKEEKSRIWMPVLIFENTRDKSSTIEDEKRKGFVKKMGISKYAEVDDSNVNKEIF